MSKPAVVAAIISSSGAVVVAVVGTLVDYFASKRQQLRAAYGSAPLKNDFSNSPVSNKGPSRTLREFLELLMLDYNDENAHNSEKGK